MVETSDLAFANCNARGGAVSPLVQRRPLCHSRQLLALARSTQITAREFDVSVFGQFPASDLSLDSPLERRAM
jgi:hypothetical protein